MTDYVERNGRKIPVIPRLPDSPPYQPEIPDPNAPVAICGECGMEIYQVMGYVCPNVRCPAGIAGS